MKVIGEENDQGIPFCPMGPMSGGQQCIMDKCPWWTTVESEHTSVQMCAIVCIAESLVSIEKYLGSR